MELSKFQEAHLTECIRQFRLHRSWPLQGVVKGYFTGFWQFLLLGFYDLGKYEAEILKLDPSAFNLMKYSFSDEDKESFISNCSETFRVSRGLPTKNEWFDAKISELIDFHQHNKKWPQKGYLASVLQRTKSGALDIAPEQKQRILQVDEYALDQNDVRKMFDQLFAYKQRYGTWPRAKSSELGRWWSDVCRGKVAISVEYHKPLKEIDSSLYDSCRFTYYTTQLAV